MFFFFCLFLSAIFNKKISEELKIKITNNNNTNKIIKSDGRYKVVKLLTNKIKKKLQQKNICEHLDEQHSVLK